MPVVVPFSNVEPIVGVLEPEDRETKGLAPPPPPLGTFVALGATTVTRLTAATTGLDPGVAQAIAADTSNHYYHVRFSSTLHPSGNATFEKAWVLGTLTAVGDEPAPIALSLDPLRSAQPVELTESFELGFDFKIVSAKADIGSKIPSSLVFVEALNEGRSDPAWEFTQSAASRLSGLQRLQLIVRTGKAGGHGVFTLLANVEQQNFQITTYRARFGEHPEIAFDLK